MNDADKLNGFLAEIPLKKAGVAPVRPPVLVKQNPRIDMTPEEWKAMDAHFAAEEESKANASAKKPSSASPESR